MATNAPYQNAKKALDSLRLKTLREDLRTAILARDTTAIRSILDAFVAADISDTFNDVESAERYVILCVIQ